MQLTLLEDFFNIVIHQPVLVIKYLFNYCYKKSFMVKATFPLALNFSFFSIFCMWAKITGTEIQLFSTSDSLNN